MTRYSFFFSLIVGLMSIPALASAEMLVLAAASLTAAVSDIVTAYSAKYGEKIKTSFASSSVLAKQIENGIAADVFISADHKWLDYLDNKHLIYSPSRRDLLGNTLVLIAPKVKAFTFTLTKGADLAAAFDGKLCLGEPTTVPAGRYAKEALQSQGMWDGLTARRVSTANVTSALAFVERAECSAGVVYATDARHSDKVQVVGTFPEDSHTPIVYSMALVKKTPSAQTFADFLGQAEASAVFVQYGFKPLQP